ncbi:MAG: 5'-3' exonuclease H3TH domain-containing protein [Porticoccaceae bacterium]|nr:5'-3' exonuclease H3TH domain-containing protein [Porticoccaceae bacterium]MDG1474164.1 5'-3' exonuclease H3TH domain-containing protein [Porticoccaceae bacterium]
MQAFLVDSSIYIFRSYFTLPENWHSSVSGHPTNAVYGFTQFMLDFLLQKQPKYMFCAFDESLHSGFRHQLCGDYKSNRELPDEGLAFQLNACRQLCTVLGISHMASDKYEADDLIGSMTFVVKDAGVQPVIISRDKDLLQLIDDDTLYWDLGKAQPKVRRQIEKELDIGCGQMADYLALVGDQSDSIVGVSGIGDKTARQLLNYFPNVEAIIEHVDQLQDLPIRGAKTLASRLAGCTDQIKLSKTLATIVKDAPGMPCLNEISWTGVQVQAFELFSQEMGFGHVFDRRIASLKQQPDLIHSGMLRPRREMV